MDTIFKIEYGTDENQLSKLGNIQSGDTHNYSTDLNTYKNGLNTIDVFKGRKLAKLDIVIKTITKLDTTLEPEGFIEINNDLIFPFW